VLHCITKAFCFQAQAYRLKV